MNTTRVQNINFVRCTSKTIKTVAKINLLHLLNESVVRPVKNLQKTEYLRNKIKSEYDLGISKEHNEKKEILQSESEYSEILPSPKKYNRIEVMTMSSGKYVHYGVERFLKRVLKMNGIMDVQYEDNTILYIDVAFYVVEKDIGLEVPQYLVILGRPVGRYYYKKWREPFVIGVYEGLFTSATIANEILRPFVDEVLSIRDTKIVHDNMMYSVEIRAIICDPIANSLVTCTSLPDSLFGCSKCDLGGKLEFNNSATSYPEFCEAKHLRSDDDFLQPKQIDHHTGVPILRELDVGLISQTYIDYKYTVCLGVMKQLLELWMFKGKLDYRLNTKTINDISNELEYISENLPMEFLAAPKTLEDGLENWTAGDYRQFLLYYAPVVLHKRLTQKYYNHFLHLNVALRILINPGCLIEFSANICWRLLNDFVAEFSQIYGADLIDYNIHNLLHLDASIYKSSLDSVGGFMYDTQMDLITTNIMNGVDLDGLTQRIVENTDNMLRRKKKSTKTYPYFDGNHNLICRNAILSALEPDNYVIMKNHEIVLIDEITTAHQPLSNRIIIYGREVQSDIVYEAPVTIQKMVLMRKMSWLQPQKLYKFEDIEAKAVKFSTSSGDYILPLLTSYCV